MAERTARETIQLANERMTITQACRFIGMDLGDFSFTSAKLYCPFGELMHEDGGRSKSFRVYSDTNSAYCFACVMAYRPVSLVAMDKDVPEVVAAEMILEETGYIAPDFMSRWEAATREEVRVDRDALEEALRTYCARIDPEWEFRQLDPEVVSVFRKCLEASRNVSNEEESRQWLDVTKKVMNKILSSVASESQEDQRGE